MSPTYTHRGRISASVPTPAGASNSLGGLLALSSVPPQLVVAAALASYAGQMAAGLSGWPLWALVLATLLPWAPLVGSQLLAMARHQPWLALLALLTLTQVGHLGEHLTQMTQLHVLHLDGAHAHGIFGALDIEWVHFGWNTWVALAVAALAAGALRRNPWLWATLALAGWHEAEHVYILSTYLATGIPGAPGLLAAGGALGGGLRLARPDLHFVYNLFETAPLVAAFVYQLRRSRPSPNVTSKARCERPGSPRRCLHASPSPPIRVRPSRTCVQATAAESMASDTKGSSTVPRPRRGGGISASRLRSPPLSAMIEELAHSRRGGVPLPSAHEGSRPQRR